MSASGPVAICNWALGEVGGGLITSLDQEGDEARLCRIHYPAARNALLTEEDWNFARRRLGPLSPTGIAPPWGWSYAFKFPTDALSIRFVTDEPTTRHPNTPQIRHEIEGNEILTDVALIYIKYTVLIKDTTKFFALFTEALQARLARELALPIAESKTLWDRLNDAYEEKIVTAYSADAIQGDNDRIRATRLTSARYRGSRSGFSSEYRP